MLEVVLDRASDTAYVVWSVTRGTPTTVTPSSASDGDLTEDPSGLTEDPSGRLGLAYRTGTELMYRHTTDVANGCWSAPERVAGAGTFAGPQVALDAHGDGWIVFYDGIEHTVGAVSVSR